MMAIPSMAMADPQAVKLKLIGSVVEAIRQIRIPVRICMGLSALHLLL